MQCTAALQAALGAANGATRDQFIDCSVSINTKNYKPKNKNNKWRIKVTNINKQKPKYLIIKDFKKIAYSNKKQIQIIKHNQPIE